MSKSDARELVRRLYGLEPKDITELPSYDDRNYHVTFDVANGDARCHGNAHLQRCHGYVLKVMNAEASQKRHAGKRRRTTTIKMLV